MKNEDFKLSASEGLYYDLIHLPHGHLPVKKVRFWGKYKMLVKQLRDNNFYTCPNCGRKSFFKTCFCSPHCSERIRTFLKYLDLVVLPILAHFGKAWYVRSCRYHASDYTGDYKRRQPLSYEQRKWGWKS